MKKLVKSFIISILTVLSISNVGYTKTMFEDMTDEEVFQWQTVYNVESMLRINNNGKKPDIEGNTDAIVVGKDIEPGGYSGLVNKNDFAIVAIFQTKEDFDEAMSGAKEDDLYEVLDKAQYIYAGAPGSVMFFSLIEGNVMVIGGSGFLYFQNVYDIFEKMDLTDKFLSVIDYNNSNKETEQTSGIRQEIIDEVEVYKTFFDDYINFMLKMKDDPTDLSLWLDYADMLSKFNDYSEKIEKASDNENLTDEERNYYLDAWIEIEKKLLDALGEVAK